MQADSIVPNPGNPSDLNRYVYGANNPIRFNDPSGHVYDEGWGGGGGQYACGTAYGAPCGVPEADRVEFEANLSEAGPVVETVVGIVCEPADWAITFNYWRQGDFHWTDLVGMLPFIPASGVRALRHSDELYSGVRKASEYLQSQNTSRKYRKQIIESFDIETIKVRPAGADEFGIRYYDNVDAAPEGRYLFDTFPASRDSLAIQPEWNEMTHFKQWQIRPETIIIEGRAAPQGRLSGGAIQKFILFLEDLLP